MTKILTLKQIETILPYVDIVKAMEEAFMQYNLGNVVVPPVAEMLFDKPKGDTHIKYGYIKNDDFFVIKVASGFYDNHKFGISSSQGLMLLFSQKTGEPKAVLLDEGRLTDLRTAAAGAVVARHFAPKENISVGIVGTGIQARLQLKYLLKDFIPKAVWVWGRDQNKTDIFASDLSSLVNVKIAGSPQILARNTNLIVTTTPAENAIINVNDVQPGTHITAMGSDTASKQELDVNILDKADIVVTDSLEQSKSRGEVFKAMQKGYDSSKAVELGSVLLNPELGRSNNKQITVADLTGVAVQDIMIAKTVYLSYINSNQKK